MEYGAFPPLTEFVNVTVCPKSISVGEVADIVTVSWLLTVIEAEVDAVRPSASVTVAITEYVPLTEKVIWLPDEE